MSEWIDVRKEKPPFGELVLVLMSKPPKHAPAPHFPFALVKRVDRRADERYCWASQWEFSEDYGSPYFASLRNAYITHWKWIEEPRDVLAEYYNPNGCARAR